MNTVKINNKIIIRQNLQIGDLDAETDTDLLDSCFIDKGYIEQLCDVHSPKSIILGRTGAGKSAILYKISQTTEKHVKIDPNDISVRFLEYSDIIQFMNAIGVNLDLFYRLLWRHILIVEVLKIRYDIKNDLDNRNFLDNITNFSEKMKLKTKRLHILENGGTNFG
ncbi:P-loop NTPase family protein [Aeromonas veronii]|uniref:hypothetical protein n=1 Tax=Aeromonas veronii TaxID=654 RepID=UPI0039828682